MKAKKAWRARCKGCERGAPFDGPYDITRQCRLCWLFHNNEHYRREYGDLGLGDYVALFLSYFGITKDRFQKLLGRPCKCGQRQEQLNRLGDRILSYVQRLRFIR